MSLSEVVHFFVYHIFVVYHIEPFTSNGSRFDSDSDSLSGWQSDRGTGTGAGMARW